MKVSVICAMAACLCATAASAYETGDRRCGTYDDIAHHLDRDYQENLIATGVSKDGQKMVEVLTSEDGATWTILVSSPDGTSCIVAFGKNWKSMPGEKK